MSRFAPYGAGKDKLSFWREDPRFGGRRPIESQGECAYNGILSLTSLCSVRSRMTEGVQQDPIILLKWDSRTTKDIEE